MGYSGATFPLTVLGDNENITANRDITFDFSDFMTGENNRWSTDVEISDVYTLTNSAANDKTVNLVYPFVGSFAELERALPTITVDDNAVSSELIAGDFSRYVISWEDYYALLSSNERLEYKLENLPKLNQTVIVYEFANTWNDSESDFLNITATFDLDYEQTTVLSHNFYTDFDVANGSMSKTFTIPIDEGWVQYGSSFYLIVIGDDIENFETRTFATDNFRIADRGSLDESEAGADITRYEAVFSDILENMFQTFEMGQNDIHRHNPVNETLHRAMAEFLLANESLFGNGIFNNNYISSLPSDDDNFSDNLNEIGNVIMRIIEVDRLFYLTAEVTIPAGESVVVTMNTTKRASYDEPNAITDNIAGLNGFDMVTNHPNFEFDSVIARLKGTETIRIVHQNFGFGSENANKVTLDLSEPHYFIEVVPVP